MYVYIRYRHTLKWLCLGRLVVTSLRNYLQMHLMFSCPAVVSKTLFMIISITATHVRLNPSHLPYVSIIPPETMYVSCSKQGSKKRAVCKQNNIPREGSNKSES